MPSPILARADALMHRRRQSDVEFDDIPVLTDAIENDDFPVLTDIEPAESAPVLAIPDITPPDVPEIPLIAATPSLDRQQIAHELAALIEQRLREELPNIVSTAVMEYLDRQTASER